MQTARIAELLEPYLGPPEARRLKPEAVVCISTYIDLLKRWNARINLTAIRNEEEIVTRHFGESFFAARYLFPGSSTPGRAEKHVGTAAFGCPVDSEQSAGEAPRRAHPKMLSNNKSESDRGRAALKGRVKEWEEEGASAPGQANDERPTTNNAISVADVGSGAGFPGVPIKLYAPEISLTLIESNHKKATFLKELTRTLTLTDINIQTARAEALAPSSFDVVTLRAVERFDSVLPIASRLVAPRGRLALLIGSAQYSVAQTILSDLAWSAPIAIPDSQSRIVAIATKSAST